MSISRAFAKQQTKRLSGVPFFPMNETALSELTDAIQGAMSETIAVAVVSAFIDESTATKRCPTPGDIRRALQTRAATKAKPPKCRVCDSTGFTTKYRLITYRTGSYEILKTQRLNLDIGELIEFRKKLGPNQDILGGAEPCSCLPANHQLLTGEAE